MALLAGDDQSNSGLTTTSSARPDLRVHGPSGGLVMDTSKQTGVYAPEIHAIVVAMRDMTQQLTFIRDQLREIDLTLQAIVAYND